MKKHIALLVVSVLVVPSAFADGYAAWGTSIQRLLSSFSVMDKQISVSGSAVGATRISATQAELSAAQERSMMRAVRQSWEDFGPDGQLSDPCYQLHLSDKAGEVVVKTDTSSQNASELVYRTGLKGQQAARGLGGAVGMTTKVTDIPYSLQVADKEDRHKSKYCSVAEANAGYCQLTPTGMQSADSDFSAHIAPGVTFGWEQTEAATDFVKNIAPTPAAAVKTGGGKCADPVCMASARRGQEQEAVMSMARYSFLRFVESRTTQASGDAKQPVGN